MLYEVTFTRTDKTVARYGFNTLEEATKYAAFMTEFCEVNAVIESGINKD